MRIAQKVFDVRIDLFLGLVFISLRTIIKIAQKFSIFTSTFQTRFYLFKNIRSFKLQHRLFVKHNNLNEIHFLPFSFTNFAYISFHFMITEFPNLENFASQKCTFLIRDCPIARYLN